MGRKNRERRQRIIQGVEVPYRQTAREREIQLMELRIMDLTERLSEQFPGNAQIVGEEVAPLWAKLAKLRRTVR